MHQGSIRLNEVHDRLILISFECDHWLDYDYVNGSPLSRACGQCFNGSPLMPDGWAKEKHEPNTVPHRAGNHCT